MRTFTLPGGLVDAHFHAALDFEDRGLSRERLIELNLAALQRAGVLAARDVGQPPDAPWLEQGDRLVAARTLLAPPRRYFPRLSEPTPPERLVDTAVAQVRAGARWVKVIADFPGPDGNWFEAPANYPPETLRAMADAVHAEGGRVAAHTTGTAAADAVVAGADTIEHGPTLDEERIEEMAHRGTAWVPTLWAATRHVPPAALGPLVARLRPLLALALRVGVPVLAGSDEAPAGSLHLEVAKLVEIGGLSPEQALRAASTDAREVLELPVCEGDLVTYAGDPRDDVGVLAEPLSIVVA
jgi:imidazolonepropionase-like amidohydrolase